MFEAFDFEGNQTFNISHEFPCFLGYSPNKHLPKGDFGLMVDVDVPWFPADVQHSDKSYWAHIDVDTLKAASPMWTFPGNIRLQARKLSVDAAFSKPADLDGVINFIEGHCHAPEGAR